jgi:K+-transporting ATPase KdpF subunit
LKLSTSPPHDRPHLHPNYHRLLRPDDSLHPRLRESLGAAKMENLIVGLIAIGLIGYLVFTIVRPEKF